MSMISTLSTLQKSLGQRQGIADQDRAVQKARQEMTTGLKSDVYGDGSFRAAQTLDMRNRMARSDAYAVSNELLSAKMDVMSEGLGNIRRVVQDFSALMTSMSGEGQGAHVLQSNAKATLTQISNYFNTVYAGEYLYSGATVGKPSLTIPETGFSIGTLPENATEAQVREGLEAVNAYFGLGVDYSTTSYLTEAYAGSKDLQFAQIDENSSISYGVTLEDEGMRSLFKGLSMLANSDVNALTGAAQDLWMKEALDAVTKGVDGISKVETDLGNARALVSRTVDRQHKLGEIYNNRVVDIEGVDSYEAATRLEHLSGQLEASYAVTVRLKSLSLLNFL